MQLVTDNTILQPDAGDGENIANDEIIRDDAITFDEALQLLETDGRFFLLITLRDITYSFLNKVLNII